MEKKDSNNIEEKKGLRSSFTQSKQTTEEKKLEKFLDDAPDSGGLPKTSIDRKDVSFKMEVHLINWYADYAHKNGKKKNALMNLALTEFMEKHKS